jgi:hypothetical protein
MPLQIKHDHPRPGLTRDGFWESEYVFSSFVCGVFEFDMPRARRIGGLITNHLKFVPTREPKVEVEECNP